MSKINLSLLSVAKSSQAKKEFAEVYIKYPDVIKSLCGYEGEIGELARLSMQCAEGGKVS